MILESWASQQGKTLWQDATEVKLSMRDHGRMTSRRPWARTRTIDLQSTCAKCMLSSFVKVLQSTLLDAQVQ